MSTPVGSSGGAPITGCRPSCPWTPSRWRCGSAAGPGTTSPGWSTTPTPEAQYTSIAFTSRLIDEGIDPSVGSVGDAYDNALAEATIGTYKTEFIRRLGPWRNVDHVETETMFWIDWYNTERPHDYLDDLTPAHAEELHCAHLNTLQKAG